MNRKMTVVGRELRAEVKLRKWFCCLCTRASPGAFLVAIR